MLIVVECCAMMMTSGCYAFRGRSTILYRGDNSRALCGNYNRKLVGHGVNIDVLRWVRAYFVVPRRQHHGVVPQWQFGGNSRVLCLRDNNRVLCPPYKIEVMCSSGATRWCPLVITAR